MIEVHNPVSQTFHPQVPLAHLAGMLAQKWEALKSDLVSGLKPREPRTPEELLEWAGRYEATQPSYAADLRAAALRAQEIAARRVH